MKKLPNIVKKAVDDILTEMEDMEVRPHASKMVPSNGTKYKIHGFERLHRGRPVGIVIRIIKKEVHDT